MLGMGGARVSFVEPAEASEASAIWRVEHVDHPEFPVHLAVVEDHHGELLAAVSLGDRSWIDRLAQRLRVRLRDGDARSRAAGQLREYLDGARREFELRLLAHGSEFERKAWAALLAIPFGETRSYAEQARMLSLPGAARAVGRANGRNPIPIVVPCHRVIGSDGSLTGFAGGLALKRWLLAHEHVRLPSEAGPRLVPSNQLGLFDHGFGHGFDHG